MRRLIFGVGLAMLVGICGALAATVTGTVTITIPAAVLALILSPASTTLPTCLMAPGTVVSAASTTGGNGATVTFAAPSGDTADFVMNGANLVVGSAGIAATNCGKTVTVQVSATQ